MKTLSITAALALGLSIGCSEKGLISTGTGLDSAAALRETGGADSAPPDTGWGSTDGGTTGGGGTDERYHPSGYSSPDQHGTETKLNVQDCRDCHGDDLEGGDVEVSCDTCHTPEDPPAWRTDCTFCHGGVLDSTGAPPLDIDGESDPERISYRAHASHVGENNHAPFACSECHSMPADVLSSGHLFDSTPAQAEVDFSEGLSAAAFYDGAGGCSSLYCHGDGQGDNGSSEDDGIPRTCSSCHPDASSGGWSAMSGEHNRHMGEGLSCSECHADTADADQRIITPELHVDGEVELVFEETTMYDISGYCTGYCHGEFHLNSW